MRHVKIPVYRFAELSEDAREAVKQRWMERDGYPHSVEALDSLKELTAHFGGKLTDWSIDWFGGSYSSAKFDMDGDGERDPLSEEEIERKLADLGSFDSDTGRGHGECVFTGFCTDEWAIDGFRIAWRAGERDLCKLMRAAFDEWLRFAQEDCADFYSDEQFAEHCEANEYEFYEDGRLVDKAAVEYLDGEADDAE